jgi:hypothetical protein
MARPESGGEYESEWRPGNVEMPKERGDSAFGALKDRLVAEAREQLRGAVESGQAEVVGHRAIDASAQLAEQSLKLLPPGTRMVGRFAGKRAIRYLEAQGHEKLTDRMGQPQEADWSAVGQGAEGLQPHEAGWPDEEPAAEKPPRESLLSRFRSRRGKDAAAAEEWPIDPTDRSWLSSRPGMEASGSAAETRAPSRELPGDSMSTLNSDLWGSNENDPRYF